MVPLGIGEYSGRLKALLVVRLLTGMAAGLTFTYLLVYLHVIRGFGLQTAGFVVAGGGLASTIGGFLLGSKSSRLGSWNLVLWGLTVSGIASILTGQVHSVPIAVLAISLQGLSQIGYRQGYNHISSVSLSGVGLARYLSLGTVGINAGFGVGAVTTGFIVNLNASGSFVLIYRLSGLIILGSALVVWIAVQRFPPRHETKGLAPQAIESHSTRVGYRAAMRDYRFLAFTVLRAGNFLFGLALMEVAWTAFVIEYSAISTKVVGISFTVDTLFIVALQVPITTRAVRFSRSGLLTTSAIAFAFGWGLTGLTSVHMIPIDYRDALCMLSMMVFGLGESLMGPSWVTLLNELAPPGAWNVYYSYMSALTNGSMLLGPPLAAALLGAGGPLPLTVVAVLGNLLTSGGLVIFGRRLPKEIDRF